VNFESWLNQRLTDRKDKNLFRELKNFSTLKDFCSNDYLGLARSTDLFNLVHDKIESLNLNKNGATGSRLLSGNSYLTEEIEFKLSQIFKSEASLIFNSGYSANLSVLSSIPQKGDTIIYDELAHACIKDGARLSLANRYSFRHNDLNDLEQKLNRSSGKIFVAVESIYSMDGDECPLHDLVNLTEKYNATIILDEAHSTGLYGPDGSGLAVSLGLEHRIAIRVYTFGKAMGCHGACVAGSKNLVSYLINFARPFIYTTALSPHSIVTIDCAFDYLHDNTTLQRDAQERIQLFNSETENVTNRIISNSAIQVILIPGNENARNTSQIFNDYDFDVRPILSPTVKEGHERLRICLHTFNSVSEIKELTALIKKQITCS
jgi:8-amino-7-oxononanoate synthase